MTPPIDPPINPYTHPQLGVSPQIKFLNRIELYQLGQDLFDF